MPSANASTATAVNPGLRANVRRPKSASPTTVFSRLTVPPLVSGARGFGRAPRARVSGFRERRRPDRDARVVRLQDLLRRLPAQRAALRAVLAHADVVPE